MYQLIPFFLLVAVRVKKMEIGSMWLTRRVSEGGKTSLKLWWRERKRPEKVINK